MSEYETLIKLKYGEVKPTSEYFDRLPPEVIGAVYKLIYPISTGGDSPQIIGAFLMGNLLQSRTKLITERTINDTLIMYHKLQDTL